MGLTGPWVRDINKSTPTREQCPLLTLLHFSSMIYPTEKQVSLICLCWPTRFKNSLLKCTEICMEPLALAEKTFDTVKKIHETNGRRSELLQWSFP